MVKLTIEEVEAILEQRGFDVVYRKTNSNSVVSMNNKLIKATVNAELDNFQLTLRIPHSSLYIQSPWTAGFKEGTYFTKLEKELTEQLTKLERGV